MPEDVDDILLEAEDHMDKSVAALQHELSQVRTGRASPALVENVKVDYHGSPTELRQLAMIRTPEARLIVIEPWDKSCLKMIERGLAEAKLGLNPQNDGQVVRIAIPPLTEERRREMVKLCQQAAEQGRVAVRNVRRDAIEKLRKLQKNGGISEDDSHRAQEEVQSLTDQQVERIEKLLTEKEAELLEE